VKILAFVNYYLPGCKGGGPIRSVANMAAMLGDEFHFNVVTTDRDHRDTQPYASVKSGEWQQVGQADVLYLAPRSVSLRNLRRIMNSTDYDVLYLNSLFHSRFTIRPLLLWWARMVRRTPVVIAPRGEFSPGALSIKRLKKYLFLVAAKFSGLYDGVVWHASSSYEEEDIRRWFGRRASVGRAPVIVAPDLVPPVAAVNQPLQREKQPGRLRLIFVSRLSPKKNLDGALRLLKGLTGSIEFDIYGHVDSDAYWSECQKIIRELPPNIKVVYRGALSHDRVMDEFSKHDLLFLPTLGENFGHVIVESLKSGCPVLISDQTPWRDLQAAGAGWDFPLSDPVSFREVLQSCTNMGKDEHQLLRDRARAYADTITKNDEVTRQNQDLFRFVSVQKRAANDQKRATNESFLEQHFAAVAAVWDDKFQPGGSMENRVSAFVHALQAHVKRGSRVLDFGCGTGNITIACHNAGFLMHGVDVNAAMIARARQRPGASAVRFSLLGATRQEGSAQEVPGATITAKLPYASGSFAAVIASSVLEYVDDPQECLRELARVTEPRGALIFTVPNVRDPRRWAEATLRHVISPRLFKGGSKWQSYAEYLKLSKNRLGLAEWKQLLAQSGWELEQVNARDSALMMLIAKRTAARAEKVDQSEARITERATQADEHAVAVSHAG
jgi:glycosyltransferase involved in cell wall biosynthesis/ubiquinone/menaquinone biosynthesis C-methylase UbiE